MSLFDSFCLSHISFTLLSKASGRSALPRKAFRSLLAISHGVESSRNNVEVSLAAKNLTEITSIQDQTQQANTPSHYINQHSSILDLKLMA